MHHSGATSGNKLNPIEYGKASGFFYPLQIEDWKSLPTIFEDR